MLTLIIIIFAIGYLAIAFEHSIRLNKAAAALLTGGLCWTVYILTATTEQETHHITEQLFKHLGEIAGILFFLLGAMTIVELIDAHDGFEVLTNAIATTDKRKLLWIVCLFSFFLSAVLDNLTTAIVMVSLVRKLMNERNDRLLFSGMIIIAANAGGAWSPIGDVTTTMLWMGKQITATNIISSLLVPSIVCMVVPLIAVSFTIKGKIEKPAIDTKDIPTPVLERNIIFFSGLGVLLLVPVFKAVTHLPPFMGMLIGLGVVWVISEILHKDKDEENKTFYSVIYALRKIDTPSILFFLGILMAVAALQSTGQLEQLATFINQQINNISMVVLSIGLLSAVIDNVPLVAAAQGMYSLEVFPTDHYFWEFLSYCAGTGGSALIIGSAAGVAAMGLEKIDFFWYLKKISWLALIGYFAGAFTFIIMHR